MTTATAIEAPILSGDEIPLAVGLAGWLARSTDRRTGQLQTVQGRLHRIYPSGRIVVITADTGARAHGGARQFYVLAPPAIRHAGGVQQLDDLAFGDEECPVCSGVLGPADTIRVPDPAHRPQAVAYLRCPHCGHRASARLQLRGGLWRPVLVDDVDGDNPARRAAFDAAFKSAKDLAA